MNCLADLDNKHKVRRWASNSLLFGRLGLHAQLELGRELHSLGDRALTAELNHHRVERALHLLGKLEDERGLSGSRFDVE